MRGTSMRSRIALPFVIGLLTAIVSAQTAPTVDLLEEVLGRVATRVEAYFTRAQKVLLAETTMIQNIGSDFSPQGFARVLEADLRVESDVMEGDGDNTVETRVVREFRKVNGHQPRKKDDQDCLDPNPISPEPLAFLLRAQREKYDFKLLGPGKGKDSRSLIVEFRELGSGKPEVHEREDKREGCFSIDIPGRARGRVWIDASTYEVLRVDQWIGRVDFRVPDKKRRRVGLDDIAVLERLDTSIRYKAVPFSDPEETVLLPESIDTVMIVRGMQSYRMRQTFSNYRRFVTGGRLVK
jgi:hypothetical protein